MILAIRTDKATAELSIYDSQEKEIDRDVWQADRKLADELLPHIQNLLYKNNFDLPDLSGIIIFTGDGSFTGLRIGTTVANTLAYSLSIPIVEARGSDWLKAGFKNLLNSKPGNYVVPKYSKKPNITKPKT